MIRLLTILHQHRWDPTPHTFALLPKLNIPAAKQKGMEGKIEECECGAHRWLHPKLRTVRVDIVDNKA